MRAPTFLRLVTWIGAGCAALAGPTSAQLISPGRLGAAHAELEGMRNCTSCHRLRQQGIDPELCLACHTPLAGRLERDVGFHATLAEEDCAVCHKDHFGEDFQLVRFDTLEFDHGRTGYDLEGAHGEAGCRDCHTPSLVTDEGVRRFKTEHGAIERTYLGLPTACATCHESDDPHEAQFPGRGCDVCHALGGWEEAPGFDHDEARYPLTGRHRQVSCDGCHAPLASRAPGALRFRPLEFGRCTVCHDDPHAGGMPGRCEACHGTAGWERVNRTTMEASFDHSTTGFTLDGAHGAAPCASCHDAAAAAGLEDIRIAFVPGSEADPYPPPRSETCSSCHEDEHSGEFSESAGAGDGGGGACEGCHGQDRWLPSNYGLDRHLSEAAFPLQGAHLVIPCEACHRSPDGVLRFRIEERTCVSCHREIDPHAGQFEDRDCAECHGLEVFPIRDFDHDGTRYPLDGAHLEVSCDACHPVERGDDGEEFLRYRPLGTECRDCHGGGA